MSILTHWGLRSCTGSVPWRNPKAPGGAEFKPELIHNRSGAGSTILATDLNQDGAGGHRDLHESRNLYLLGQTQSQGNQVRMQMRCDLLPW